MIEKHLGKISNCSFGYGGYQGAQIGIFFDFECNGGGISDGWAFWSGKRSENARWSDADRIEALGEITMRIDWILKSAKKESVAALVGTPVEITMEDFKLVTWRVLTEVI
jgi:hypothetical protein